MGNVINVIIPLFDLCFLNNVVLVQFLGICPFWVYRKN